MIDLVIVKTVKVSSNGRFTLPAEVVRALKLRKGTDVLLVQDGERLLLLRADAAGRRLVDESGGWDVLAQPAFATLWGNVADDVWNEG